MEPKSPDNSLSTLSPEIQILVQKLVGEQQPIEQEEKPTIHINMTTGRAAFIYEKIRNTISYQDEQIIRRLAISRIISRRAVFDKDEKTIASGLIWELIQSGYFENDRIPEEKIAQIIKVLKKYSAAQKYIATPWKEYFFGIMGCEIEATLVDYTAQEELLNALHAIILRQLFPDKEINNYQHISDYLYYSLIQLCFKLDKPSLRFYALKYKFSDWQNLDEKDIDNLSDKISSTVLSIEECLKTLPTNKLLKIARRYYPLYIVMQKIIANQPAQVKEILLSKQKLIININKITAEYFNDTISKLNRSILKAVLFIFSTKVLLGIIFEVPYDRFFHGSVHYQPLLINILFPPVLMYISVSMISVPGSENAKKIVQLAKSFIYNETDDPKDRKKIGNILSRGKTLQALLAFFYSITFLFTIGILIYLLHYLGFNIVSGFLFFLFLSIVSFFAFRIRRSATDLVVVEQKENTFAIILDFLLMPFLKIGFWLAKKFEKANILVLFFDFILEAPFKTILEGIEHWIAFMKEKKDEITP